MMFFAVVSYRVRFGFLVHRWVISLSHYHKRLVVWFLFYVYLWLCLWFYYEFLSLGFRFWFWGTVRGMVVELDIVLKFCWVDVNNEHSECDFGFISFSFLGWMVWFCMYFRVLFYTKTCFMPLVGYHVVTIVSCKRVSLLVMQVLLLWWSYSCGLREYSVLIDNGCCCQ